MVSGIVNAHKVVYPNFFPDTLATMKAIQEEKCTSLKGAPVIFIDLLNHPDIKKYDLSSLELILLGASTVPKDLLLKIKEKLNLKHVIIGYGMTESGVIGSLTRVNDIKKSEKFAYETIGQGLPFVELKVIDKENQIVPRNVDGELCIRGSIII